MYYSLTPFSQDSQEQDHHGGGYGRAGGADVENGGGSEGGSINSGGGSPRSGRSGSSDGTRDVDGLTPKGTIEIMMLHT